MFKMKCKMPIFKTKMYKRGNFLSSKIKLMYTKREKFVLVNIDNFFLSVPSFQSQELVTSTFWRCIIYIGVYGIRVCDFLT